LARLSTNPQLRLSMSVRLKHVVDHVLGLTIEECSRKLGYANSSSLRKAFTGDAFVDPEKLYLLSKITGKFGHKVNVHWIITGDGLPHLIEGRGKDEYSEELMGKINSLSKDKREALSKFLD